VCVCVCIYIYTHTHTHTHTYIYNYPSPSSIIYIKYKSAVKSVWPSVQALRVARLQTAGWLLQDSTDVSAGCPFLFYWRRPLHETAQRRLTHPETRVLLLCRVVNENATFNLSFLAVRLLRATECEKWKRTDNRYLNELTYCRNKLRGGWKLWSETED
jgi:hypothetical protein